MPLLLLSFGVGVAAVCVGYLGYLIKYVDDPIPMGYCTPQDRPEQGIYGCSFERDAIEAGITVLCMPVILTVVVVADQYSAGARNHYMVKCYVCFIILLLNATTMIIFCLTNFFKIPSIYAMHYFLSEQLTCSGFMDKAYIVTRIASLATSLMVVFENRDLDSTLLTLGRLLIEMVVMCLFLKRSIMIVMITGVFSSLTTSLVLFFQLIDCFALTANGRRNVDIGFAVMCWFRILEVPVYGYFLCHIYLTNVHHDYISVMMFDCLLALIVLSLCLLKRDFRSMTCR